MSNALINKYRPETFKEMIGHEEALAALQRAIARDTHPKCFLFTGPGGLGKTTLARIVGGYFDAELLEIDAASNSGVDAARDLVELGQHMSLSGAGKRMVIIDECHTLSKNAWQVLLKITEEPPEHLFFSLCTTDPTKVPDTIKQRSYHVLLRPVSPKLITGLLTTIADVEGWEVPGDVMSVAVQAAGGSPRMGIAALDRVNGCEDEEEASRILALPMKGDPIFELCQYLAKGGRSWVIVKPLLDKMDDDVIDGAVPILGRYMTKAMKGAKDDKSAQRYWKIIDALAFPTDSWDTRVRFYAIIGRIIWGE